jgi:ribosomal protein S18 acetylase RimI-like enzyme
MKKYIKLKNGKEILLRHLKKSDIEGVWANFNEVLKEGGYLPVLTPVKSEFEKKSWYETIKKDHEVCIVALDPEIKSPFNVLGQCEISNTEWEAGTHVGMLGIIVKESYRDLGIGYHLIEMAIKASKKLNNKEKLVLSCFSTNKRAIHLYKKFGFKVIGIRKKQFYMDSIYYDEILMDLWIDDYLKEVGVE